MPDPIPLTVQGDENVSLSLEELRVVEAVSPTVTAERVTGGVEITVHDLNGTETVPLYDGAQGPQGETGTQGDPGLDGISPTITVQTITGGHRITITDAAHPQGQSVDVMDGANGSDGRGIVSILKTGTAGLVDTYTITYTSGNPTTFTVTNGAPGADGQDGQDGQDGANAYVHIRYASAQPTQDSDMSTTPGPWMGVYSGSSATAPTHYTDYSWNKVEGPQGDDYVLTSQDKSDIAALVLADLPTWTGGSY